MPCYSGDKDAALKVINEKLPAVSKYLGEKAFLTGDSPVYLDFYFFETLELMAFLTEGAVFDTFPNLAQYHKNVAELEGLKEYFASPDCIDKVRPFNNKQAQINTEVGSNVDEIIQAVYAKHCQQ